METWRHRDGDMETCRHADMQTCRHEDMDMKTSNGKWKPRQFFLIRLPFTHRANGSLSFVRLLTKKQKKVIRL
jgi:hypothetical protein